MRSFWGIIALFNIFLFSSCSSETQIADEFQLSAGESLIINTDIKSKQPYSGLYFTLKGVPETKINRDFTDFINLELIDEQEISYRPQKIWDINGSKRDVVASFNNLPNQVRIKTIKITAVKNLAGSKIRWWTGKLK